MLSKELVAASTVPLVLSVLAEGESYGYALIQRVRELSGGRIEWTEGMLYPVLHWMEEKGLIESDWRESDTGRKRKYYHLRKEGRKALPVLVAGAIAGGAGVATYARFRLTIRTRRMVLGGWIAIGGACACGLVLLLRQHSRMHDFSDWLALLAGPVFIALLSSWFVFPMGLVLGVLLPRLIERFGRWSSFSIGSAIGVLVTTLEIG